MGVLITVHFSGVLRQGCVLHEISLGAHVRISLCVLHGAADTLGEHAGALGSLWPHNFSWTGGCRVGPKTSDVVARELCSHLLRVEATVREPDVTVPTSAIVVIV